MKIAISALMILLVLAAIPGKARALSEEKARAFVSDLLNNPEDLRKWVLEDELKISARLDIRYEGVLNKFLISYDVSDELRGQVAGKTTSAKFKIDGLDPGYSKLSLSFDNLEFEAEYYFAGDRLISPVYYYAHNWHRYESEYFVFYSSAPTLFNAYGAGKLDEFVAGTLDVLGISDKRKERLRKEKIYYFLCKDTNDIRNLTGYDARGMYNLAYDYIVSTFNCHYHEIIHLVMNYKMRDAFLLSHPVSGLYNSFLIKQLGVGGYLGLYRKYSGEKSRKKVSEKDLPGDGAWREYLQQAAGNPRIEVGPYDVSARHVVYSDGKAEIYQGASKVYFKLKASILMSEPKTPDGFVSNLFKDYYPQDAYRGEKYLVTANENEISIYNLYTNCLIAKHVPAMSVNTQPITINDGFYSFTVDKGLLDGGLERTIVKVVPPAQKR